MGISGEILSFSSPEFGDIDGLLIENQPCVMAKGVCDALGTRTDNVRAILDDDEVFELNPDTVGVKKGTRSVRTLGCEVICRG